MNYESASGWGFIPPVFGEEKQKYFVINFFTVNAHKTVFRSINQNQAEAKAKQLAKMLDVQLLNKINKVPRETNQNFFN
ncbi:MAG: hypothetical protein KDC69_08205 [Flavobacteriaceae bacterium]|nr:hypothetical protein [Flavobacteriaceae bacterium]